MAHQQCVVAAVMMLIATVLVIAVVEINFDISSSTSPEQV